MAQFRKAVEAGVTFIVDGNTAFRFNLVKGKNDVHSLKINGVEVEAQVRLTYKHIDITIFDCGLTLSTQIGYKSLTFIPEK